MVNKYKIPNNCLAAIPPKLNPEVKAAVNEAALKRDLRLEKVQSQMGASLSALGRAFSALANLPHTEEESYVQAIEALNDGAKLLADIHHEQSLSRQNVISINLDQNLKKISSDAELDGWLFGENLHEKIKRAKQIEKSGEELRSSISRKPTKPEPKNLRNPPRQVVLGGQQPFRKKTRPFVKTQGPQSRRTRDYPYHYPQKTTSQSWRQHY